MNNYNNYLDSLKESSVLLHEFSLPRGKRQLFHLTPQPMYKPCPTCYPSKSPQKPGNPMDYEEQDIKRISVAPSIDYCLMGIGPSSLEVRYWYVYEPENYKEIKEVTNKELVRKRWVPDAMVTKESWLMTLTHFEYRGKIQVLRRSTRYKVLPDFRKKYHGFKARSRDDRKIYFWDWKWIEKK